MSKRKEKALKSRWHFCHECIGTGFIDGKLCYKCGGLSRYKTYKTPEPGVA